MTGCLRRPLLRVRVTYECWVFSSREPTYFAPNFTTLTTSAASFTTPNRKSEKGYSREEKAMESNTLVESSFPAIINAPARRSTFPPGALACPRRNTNGAPRFAHDNGLSLAKIKCAHFCGILLCQHKSGTGRISTEAEGRFPSSPQRICTGFCMKEPSAHVQLRHWPLRSKSET
jgi:hypothetical protein